MDTDAISLAESSSSFLPNSAGTLCSFETTNTIDSSESRHRPLTPPIRDVPPGFQVLCQFDFYSNDPSHINFSKGDILTIIKTESTGSTGWWGATKKGKAGWIPRSYVLKVPDAMAQNLLKIRPELRLFEFEVETNYRNATVRNLADPYASDIAEKESHRLPSIKTDVDSRSSLPPPDNSPLTATALSPSDNPYDGYSPDDPDSEFTESDTSPGTDLSPVHSKVPIHPLLQDRVSNLQPPPSNLSKPTPPTPVNLEPDNSHLISRRLSDPVAATMREKVLAQAPISAHPQSHRTPSPGTDPDDLFLSEPYDPVAPWKTQRKLGRRGASKVQALLGDDDAEAYYNAKVAQAALPPYLQPTHVGPEIRLEGDETIRAGTIEALIERLTLDSLRSNRADTYRRTFLMTFKSFTSSDKLFETLISHFYADPPPGLSPNQEREWLDKKSRPTQKRVLNILMDWLENYGMADNDPHIVPQLQQFLSRINKDSASLSLTAKGHLQSLDRILTTPRNAGANALASSPQKTTRKEKRLNTKNDIMAVDLTDLAQQLTLYEARLFAKIRPQECLASCKVQRGPAVQNLSAFCATHDKIASWVKHSILSKDGLSKRAEAVGRWIRIAEKCRHLNNISSTCAIVAALSSTVIERLHLTWAHVERRSQLVPLQRLAMPTNNFRECREVLRSIVTPCVPFIGMNLTDITHINDKFPDNIIIPPTPDCPQGITLINFAKRQTTAEIIDIILRHQARPYQFPEKPHFVNFIEQQMAISAVDDSWFWQKTQDLQQAEVAHADIKRNLEAAGF